MDMSACHFCTESYDRGINCSHWFTAGTGTPNSDDATFGGHYERIDVCDADACRDQIARKPRAPRRSRRTANLTGDVAGWSAAAQLNKKMRKS